MAFMIGLAHIDFEPQFAGAVFQHSGDIVERVGAIHLRLARAVQVEIGAVEDENGRCHWERSAGV